MSRRDLSPEALLVLDFVDPDYGQRQQGLTLRELALLSELDLGTVKTAVEELATRRYVGVNDNGEVWSECLAKPRRLRRLRQ